MVRSPTRKAGPSWQAVVDVLVLTVVLAAIALRVTITEAPPMRASSSSINRFDQAYSLILSWGLLFCIAWAWGSRPPIKGQALWKWGLGLFLAAGAAGCWIASDRRLAISQVFISAVPMALGLALGQILDRPWKRRMVLALIAALAVAGTFQCLNQLLYTNAALVSQYQADPNTLTGPLGIEPGTLQAFLFEHRLMTGGAPGFFTTRNVAGSYAVLGLFAVLALFADARSRPGWSRAIPLYGTVAVILLFGMVLTRSKGAIVGLAAAGGVAVAMTRWQQWLGRHKVMVMVLGLVILGAVIGGLVNFGLDHGRLPGGSSMWIRWQYWQATGRMIADHPWLGVGPGNFAVYYSQYKPAQALEAVADPHNFVLSLMAQYGPVGLLGFVLLVWACLMRARLRPVLHTGGHGHGHGESEVQPRWALAVSAVAVGAAMFAVRPWVSGLLALDNSGASAYAAVLDFGISGVLALAGMLLLSQDPAAGRDLLAPPERSYVSVTLGCGIVAVLVANLTDYALFEPSVATCFWAMAGCLIAWSRDSEPWPATGPRPAAGLRRRRYVAIAVSALVLLMCLNGAVDPVVDASLDMDQARKAVEAGDFAEAHRVLDRATSADRLSGAAPGMHGKVYLQQYLQADPKDPSLLNKAVDCLGIAVLRNNADFRDYERLGDAYDLLNRPDQAYQAYKEAALRYPGCDRLWLRLGQTAERCNKPQLAAEHYARAIDIEDAFRRQFAALYPHWARPVSRLGEQDYQFAKQRLGALGQK